MSVKIIEKWRKLKGKIPKAIESQKKNLKLKTSKDFPELKKNKSESRIQVDRKKSKFSEK